MSLLSRLLATVTEADGPMHDEADDRRGVAALLIHVARIDGRLKDREVERVQAILGERYGLSRRDSERLFETGLAADQEAPDMRSLVDRLETHDPAERRALLLTAYQVAFADGLLHEFEDDLAWRLGHLLGFDDATIAAVQAEALQGLSQP